MRIIGKSLISVLALAATVPLLVAQSPPPEGQGPSGDPTGNRHVGPRFGRPAHFWSDGGMGPQSWMRGREPHGLAGLVSNPQVRERLGITTEQASKIRQEEMSFRKAQIRNRADLEVRRLELAELLAADHPERTAIDKKLREVSETQFAAEKSRIDHRLAVQEALTPEQREKLKQMFSEFRRERGFDRFGPGGPGGPRPQTPPPAQKPSPPNEPST